MTTTTATTVAERVAAGATWLDEHHPGWVDRIDLDELAMSSCSRCILGQLATGTACYHDALDEHGLDHYAAMEIGFNADLSGYTALAAAWHDLIRRRREGGTS